MTFVTRYYLGIDWGTAKLGLAFADSETRIASGLETVKNDDRLSGVLEKIIRSRHIDTVVVGIPSRINREETEYESERFGRELGRRLGVRVAYQDEMYTTKLAREHLKEQGIRHLDRYDDREAARIILQEWMDAGADLGGDVS